ncbi:MAG: sigma 54-interacting transcriptional regulator, partial [Polyangiaceae bacterium]
EKGAFTGAATRRQGRFELADGGTLFLDEIGDISPRTQAALLRILQEGTYERVGGSTTLRADVRIICATHRDLHAMVQQGEFREDLYYRLCGITVAVPPLRDRRGDMGPLCDHLLQDLCARSGLDPRRMARTAVAMLSRHDWPGNIRELENTLRAAALFSQGDVIQSADLARHISTLNQDANGPVSCASPTGSARSDIAPSSGSRSSRSSQLPPPSTAPGRIDGLAGDRGSSADMVYAQIRDGIGLADMKRKIERDCIERALMEAAGNITRAAGLLGMKRPRLSQLVKQYGLATVLEEIKS